MSDEVGRRIIEWPERADVLEIGLALTRGSLVNTGQGVPNISARELGTDREVVISLTRTRLRMDLRTQRIPEAIILKYIYRGESPIPRRIQRFDAPRLPPPQANDLPLFDLSAVSVNVVAADVGAYRQCRRLYSSGDWFIARARRLFLAIDERSHPDLVAGAAGWDAARTALYRRLQHRLNPANPVGSLTGEQVGAVARIFRDARVESDLKTDREEQMAYLCFAAGLLEHPCPFSPDVAAGPNSGNIAMFAELASNAIQLGVEDNYFTERFPWFVAMFEIFKGRYRPQQRYRFQNLIRDLMREQYVAVGYQDLEHYALNQLSAAPEASLTTLFKELVGTF